MVAVGLRWLVAVEKNKRRTDKKEKGMQPGKLKNKTPIGGR
jgi:hypothetical protein